MVIFDLDGTLALSKSSIDDEMHTLLEQLLEKKDVLVISGGRYRQFREQLLDHLKFNHTTLAHMFVAPAGGSSMYRFEDGEIHEMYADYLSKEEKQKIFAAFDYALPKAGFVPLEHPYGDIVEDRQSQITFSALGQKAPLEEKNKWDPVKTKPLVSGKPVSVWGYLSRTWSISATLCIQVVTTNLLSRVVSRLSRSRTQRRQKKLSEI